MHMVEEGNVSMGHRGRGTPWLAIATASALVLAMAGAGRADEPRDLRSDTWVATDALGRSLPVAGEVGPPRPGKFVGVFYFLWLGESGELGPFDISKILARDPAAIRDPKSPLWGPMLVPHHWGESIFGHYRSNDESVLRKHAQMLADAGVDMIVFDVTNQLTYPRSWRALCRVFDQLNREGNRVPQIAFLCPFWDPAKVVRELWEDLYSRGLHEDLWFRWEGKPLILADPGKLGAARIDERDDAIRRFFTFRKPQPDYFAGPTGPRQWGWLEVYPQHAFYKTPGTAEEVAVGVAQNAVDGKLSVLTNPRGPMAGASTTARSPARRTRRLRPELRRAVATGARRSIRPSSSSPAGTNGSPAGSTGELAAPRHRAGHVRG